MAKAHESYDHQENQVVTSYIDGGNARMPLELAKRLEGQITTNKALTKLQLTDTQAVLTFQDRSTSAYDYVILAIPASTFRNIDLSDARIEGERLRKINSISYGANFKIGLRLDLSHHLNISTVTKDNVLSFYNHDSTLQILYVNDKWPDIPKFLDLLSTSYGHSVGPISSALVQAQDQQYGTYRDTVYYDWRKDHYSQGSYTGYSLTISEELDQIEYTLGIPYKALFMPIQNRLFFAGEHTTILDYIGTMEAAVESGERIAKAVAQSVVESETKKHLRKEF